MKTPHRRTVSRAARLGLLIGGLLAQAAHAQCLPGADAAVEPGPGLWLAALALMAGIAWRRHGG